MSFLLSHFGFPKRKPWDKWFIWVVVPGSTSRRVGSDRGKGPEPATGGLISKLLLWVLGVLLWGPERACVQRASQLSLMGKEVRVSTHQFRSLTRRRLLLGEPTPWNFWTPWADRKPESSLKLSYQAKAIHMDGTVCSDLMGELGLWAGHWSLWLCLC